MKGCKQLNSQNKHIKLKQKHSAWAESTKLILYTSVTKTNSLRDFKFLIN